MEKINAWKLMPDITIEKVDETYIKLIIPNKGIQLELSEHLSFDSPNKFHRKKYWDGKIRLYNRVNHQVLAGLTSEIIAWARSKNYSVSNKTDFTTESEISTVLNQTHIIPKEHQRKAILNALRKRRCLIISPTASGKSLIAYSIIKWLTTEKHFMKTLIIVPTIGLVHQLSEDFKSYGYSQEIHKIYGGQDKIIPKECNISITTWQSCVDLDKSFFNQYSVLIGDEAHLFKAKSLIDIMKNASNIRYRIGMTGTLDDTKVHHFVIQGLFGDIIRAATTEELIEKDILSPLFIHVLVLKYNKTVAKNIKSYPEEIEFITNHERRTAFIKNLANSLNGKILILFDRIEHGQLIYKLLTQRLVSYNVYFVDGSVNGVKRNDIRNLVETSKDNDIIVASYGTFSTGINIPSLDNIILASPTKSRIRLLQSIGRGLRKSPQKKQLSVYDICDHLNQEKQNHTLRHMIERIKIYAEEKFDYKINLIRLKEENESPIF